MNRRQDFAARIVMLLAVGFVTLQTGILVLRIQFWALTWILFLPINLLYAVGVTWTFRNRPWFVEPEPLERLQEEAGPSEPIP